MKLSSWISVLCGLISLPYLTTASYVNVALSPRSYATPAAPAEPPTCALLCMAELIPQSTCSLTNATCQCTNEVLIEEITVCAAQNCTIKDQLLTKRYSDDACGAKVRDRTLLVPVINATFGGLALICFILRVWSKLIKASANGFWYDDAVLLLVVLLMIPFSVNAWLLEVRGLGKDIWQVGFNHITGVLFYFYFQELIYLAVLPMLKIVFLLLYLRVFPDKALRKVIYLMIFLCVCYGFIFVGVSVFQCQPVSGAWEQWDGTWEGSCNNINLQGWTSAVINIIFDVITLSLPLVPLWKLNMAFRKKIQVMIMFSVGFFVTIISMMRLYSLLAFGSSTNVTWVYVPVSYWTTIEIDVGIICSCMPAIQPLLKKLFPNVLSLGTTNNTGPGTKGLSSASSKFSSKAHLNRQGHRELQSRDDLETFDEEASTVELVTVETKDASQHTDDRPGTAV